MPDQRRKLISRTQVQKRSNTGLVIAAVAVMALVGSAIAFTRTSILAPSSQASAAVAAGATATPATTAAQAPTTVLAAVAPWAVANAGGGEAPIAVTAEDGVIRLPAADFADGKARFYTFQGSKQTIPFFVLKSSDGVIRVAFDACDVCFPAKRGYRQEGDEMVCNNCSSRFPSTSINEVSGGCNPAPLVRVVQGDELIIKVRDIEAGAKYF